MILSVFFTSQDNIWIDISGAVSRELRRDTLQPGHHYTRVCLCSPDQSRNCFWLLEISTLHE